MENFNIQTVKTTIERERQIMQRKLKESNVFIIIRQRTMMMNLLNIL